jgi:hypothetical protein
MSYFNAGISTPYTNSLRLLDLTNTSYLTLRTTPSVASNIAFTLPSVYGSSGEVLTTDGTGNLTWGPGGGISSVSSNIITESANGNIQFSTLAGSANIHTDGANTITLSVGSNLITHSGGNLTIGMTTPSTDTTTGALVVAGGLGVGQDVRAGGNIAVGARVIHAIDTFAESAATQELWSGANTATMKHLIISVGWTANFTATTGQPSGTRMDIFFTGNAVGAAANINFGAPQLYVGSGVAQYLVFTTKGQSASLVYMTCANPALSGWRVLSTGASVY